MVFHQAAGESFMKRISINGRFLSQPVTGVQRYAHELIRELDRLLTSLPAGTAPVEVLVPRNAREYPSYKSLVVKEVGRLTGQAWEQLELPLHCSGKILFTPCGGAPLLHAFNVVTIHDTAVFATPKAYSEFYGIWYRLVHSRLSRTARRVITVSEFSKSELVRWCSIAPSRVTVTHLGCDHVAALQADWTILDRHGLRNSSYVLAVSSRNPNKNFRGVARAMNLLGDRAAPFVIAGNVNSQVFGENETLPASVIQLGYVSDAQLRALYEGAGCFVFPSFYEGFGLPPLEAMTCGCPVIAGDIGALRETCGDAALFCDPADASSIADSIACVMADSKLRQHLIERGHMRTQGFCWARTAAETWKILQEVAANS
jgi:glycosyltransferase involved in cell wall biosynthesis